MPTQTSLSTLQYYPAHARGERVFDWLHAKHSFSFGDYQRPDRMGFGPLRVLNQDIIQPGTGFGMHPHRNMEIISWMISGAMRHGDSLDNQHVLGVGDVQVMSAGSGIYHSEVNASDTDIAHMIQIWIEPKSESILPRYQQRTLDPKGRNNTWQVLASGEVRWLDTGALPIYQDATLLVADISTNHTLALPTDTSPTSRKYYLHVVTGNLTLNGQTLNDGDAVSFEAILHKQSAPAIAAHEDSQVLLFILPNV